PHRLTSGLSSREFTMQRLAVLVFSLALVGLIGCNTDTGGKKGDDTKRSETFKLKGPEMSTTIKQGDKQTVKLTVSRGKDFKHDVALSAEPPKGLSVELDPKELKAGSPEETVTATITADKEASVGDHDVAVSAKPKEGNSANVKIKVKVEGKKD